MSEPPASEFVRLARDPGACAVARAMVRDASHTWGFAEDLAEDAALVVTELVTNVLDHTDGTPMVAVERIDDGLRIAVADPSPVVPMAQPVRVNSPRQRGLMMVARMAQRWGTSPLGGGKLVWAELVANGAVR